MELAADERAAARLGDDALRPRRRARRRRGVGVCEVEGAEPVDLRPAYARHSPAREANGAPRNQPEADHAAVLVAAVERELQAEADPEHQAAGLDALAKR